MRAIYKTALSALTLAMISFAPQALACGHGRNCSPPAPPSRPAHPGGPTMPGAGGFVVNNNVVLNNSVKVNNSVTANNSVSTNNSVSNSNSASGFGVRYGNILSNTSGTGGGFSNWSQTPNYPQSMGLHVETIQEEPRLETYSESQTLRRTVILRAACIDTKGVPHPASQVFGHRDIESSYTGEIYRCIAGTHLQISRMEIDQSGAFDARLINFKGAETFDCQKGQALFYENNGLSCRAQLPARECNERSLLRRFGSGEKILTLVRTVSVTRERRIESSRTTSCMSGCMVSNMVFDGGVGGYVQ